MRGSQAAWHTCGEIVICLRNACMRPGDLLSDDMIADHVSASVGPRYVPCKSGHRRYDSRMGRIGRTYAPGAVPRAAGATSAAQPTGQIRQYFAGQAVHHHMCMRILWRGIAVNYCQPGSGIDCHLRKECSRVDHQG